MSNILIGIASWTDDALVESGVLYPPEIHTPEEMLRYYSSRFPLVEVDSSYYSLPSVRNSVLWVERTPPDFLFDVKCFGLFTQHPVDVKRLPKTIQDSLTPEVQSKARIYLKDVPSSAVSAAWDMFKTALKPLSDAGKLGAVFLQFPKWFPFSPENMAYIESCKERLSDFQIAVEFRQHTWLDDEHAAETLAFLRHVDVAFTIVDEPQGFSSSVSSVFKATSDELAVIRLHGRNRETWEKPGLKAAERFDYLYTEEELDELVPKIQQLFDQVKSVHVIFNNNYRGFAVTNAMQLGNLLKM